MMISTTPLLCSIVYLSHKYIISHLQVIVNHNLKATMILSSNALTTSAYKAVPPLAHIVMKERLSSAPHFPGGAQTASNSGVATLRNFCWARARKNACWGASPNPATLGQNVPKQMAASPPLSRLFLIRLLAFVEQIDKGAIQEAIMIYCLTR